MKYWYVASAADEPLLGAIRESVERESGIATREMPLGDVEFAFDAARGQYSSIAVLEMLARTCPPDAAKLLGVTERDLFIPVLTFVFGQAQLKGRVAVISLARLRQEFYGLAPDREILMERACKEALHEAGHTLGLVHCADRECAMSLSTNVRQIDTKRAAYCEACRAHLRNGERR
jgi:archaemetzincin